ncbi:MAG: BON domain-containing protein [Chitinophagaceae bacterium]
MFSKKLFSADIIVFICLSLVLSACGPNDQKVSENVKSSISVLDPNIQVNVTGGVVTLSGEAKDETTKNAAENAVKEIKGVKSVVNNISVRREEVVPPVTINADDMIRKSVDSSFSAKNIRGVNVSVTNGEVTLTGDVKRADLAKVMQAANESKPKRVVNQLTIK